MSQYDDRRESSAFTDVFGSGLSRRSMLKRSLAFGATASASLMLLASCGDDDDDDDDATPVPPTGAEPTPEADSDPTPDDEETPDETPDATAPPAADPTATAQEDTASPPAEDAGELVVGWGGDFITMDPAGMRTTLDTEMGYKIYSNLVRVQTGTTDEMVPDLAEQWEISEDGLTYTFNLHPEAVWHRGYGAVTAEDVAFSMLRHKDEELASNVRAEAQSIADAEIEDDHTVIIQMEQPFPGFLLEFAAYRPGFIINSRAMEDFGDRYNEQAVGSGPFVLEDWQPAERVVLARNDEFYGDAGVFSRVTYAIIEEESTTEIALERGEIDIAYFFTPEIQARIVDHSDIQSESITGPRTFYLQLNLDNAPLDDVRVRQALWYAIDKDALIGSALLGQGEATDTLLNPHVFGRLDDFAYTYDLDRARELLAEAGVADGFETTLLTTSDRLWSDISVTIQAMWRDIGVQAEIVQREWAQHVEVRRSGTFDIALQPQLRLGPDAYVAQLMHTDAIPYPNSSRYSNQEVDELIETARLTVDDDERLELYHQIQRIGHEDAPVIPLLHPVFVIGFQPDIHGAVPGLIILNITEMSRG